MKQKIKLIKKRVRRRTLFFLVFALMANAFAWFIYSNKVSSTITTGVKSWKINFKQDGADLENNVKFSVDTIYPGMNDYSDSVTITNVGETKAKVSYEITSIRIMDDNYDSNSYTSDELLEILETKYPFKLTFGVENDEVGTGESSEFKFDLTWAYESGNDRLDTTYGKKSTTWKENNSDKSQIEVNVKIIVSQIN